jgi:hypothetical protein
MDLAKSVSCLCFIMSVWVYELCSGVNAGNSDADSQDQHEHGGSPHEESASEDEAATSTNIASKPSALRVRFLFVRKVGEI